ncbi:hypothetical protein [Micromonospora sp. DPT]|uniref:hypothetical protein n=1 Tax=Micromonospora sp. DPT TaxID=3142975 RepID=UPI00320AB7D6
MRLTEAQREEVAQRAANGDTLTAIAGAYGVTRQAIRGILRRRGIPARVTGKLTEAERSEAVRQYMEGATMAQVASFYKVSEPAIRSLLIRRAVPVRSGKTLVRHDAFEDLTADACYWIGFLFADGCVSYRPGRRPQISVGLSERDREHLVALRGFLGSTSSISLAGPPRRSCQLSVRSSQLADRLIELGRYEGSIDTQLVASRDFWRGVVDGDGSIGVYEVSKVSGRKAAQFRLVGSRRLLDAFLEFLATHGMNGLSVRPHKSICTVGTTGGSAAKITSLLYSGATVSLRRKAEAAARILV